MEEYGVMLYMSKDHSLRHGLVSWVSIIRPCEKVSKGGSVKEYVKYESKSEYGLDYQSRAP
jgi:hypothetical protein